MKLVVCQVSICLRLSYPNILRFHFSTILLKKGVLHSVSDAYYVIVIVATILRFYCVCIHTQASPCWRWARPIHNVIRFLMTKAYLCLTIDIQCTPAKCTKLGYHFVATGQCKDEPFVAIGDVSDTKWRAYALLEMDNWSCQFIAFHQSEPLK